MRAVSPRLRLRARRSKREAGASGRRLPLRHPQSGGPIKGYGRSSAVAAMAGATCLSLVGYLFAFAAMPQPVLRKRENWND